MASENMAENETEKIAAPRPGSTMEVTVGSSAFTEYTGYKAGASVPCLKTFKTLCLSRVQVYNTLLLTDTM